MRGKGICYDTGFLNNGSSTHEPFDPRHVERDMRAIRDDLHATAVRITGGDVERLKTAATHAAHAGLEVWLCPFTNGLTDDELLDVLAECAAHGERLRSDGAEVVLVTGSEVSVMNVGYVPGETFAERSKAFTGPDRAELMAAIPPRLNAFLARAVETVRQRFKGKLSYASLPFEGVDWTPFDYLATDAGYRWAAIADRYPAMMRAYVEQGKALGKPVAVTEFGCATYKGAADDGPASHGVLEWDEETGTPVRINGDYVRDETGQAAYLRDSLDVFEAEGVDSAFVYTFVGYVTPHRPDDPERDLDLGWPGIVKTYPDGTWEPKEAFHMVADYYGAG